MQEKKSKIDLDKMYQEYTDLPERFNSLLLATVSDEGVPNASYAPYVKRNNDYYIFISELSIHTGNIAKTGQVSVLFLEDENIAHHIFARKRVTLQCETIEIARDNEQHQLIMSLFKDKFGLFMEMLEKNRDFHLYRVRPLNGSYVAGFGRAFKIEGEDLKDIKHVNDMGHRESAA